MLRKTALVTAMLGAFASQAYALGLGNIDLKSALNQPLNAHIEVVGATPRELSELNVVLAPVEAYNRVGLERVHFHTKLKFEIVSGKDGKGYIKVSSREPVREPFLDFLIQANWSNGQVVREYTVLVDPPVLMPAPKPAAQAPIAQPAASTSSAKPARTPVAAPAPTRSYSAGVGEYTSQRGDSLWKVAEKVRPDQDVTMEQTMLGLLEANPEAFIANNINNLKAGYVMRVPSRDEMTTISADEARAEVNRQHRAWREGRATATSAAPQPVTTAPKTTTATATTAAGKAASTAQPKLQLVAPEEDPGVLASQPGGSETGLAGVRKDLNIAVEAVEAQRQQNQELTERLSLLEEQIQKLHRLIELKDQELASLQGQQIETDESVLPQAESTEDAAAMTDEVAQVEAEAPAAMEEEIILDEEVIMDEEVVMDETVTPDKKESDFLTNLLNNPIVLGGAAGVALLVAVLLWLFGRKRRMASSEFQESILAERTTSAPVAPEPDAAAIAEASEAAVQAEPESAPTDKASSGPESDSSLFTDFAVSDMGAMQDDSEADPVAEADVYLAYGRFQQAEELVKAAIDKSPDRPDLKVKLLEIYHAARNLASFEDTAQTFAAEGGTEDESWSRIEQMAGELNSTLPLFGGAGATLADTSPAEPETVDDSPNLGDMGEAAPDEDNSLDFDLAGFDEESKPEDTLDSDLTEPKMETIVEEPSLGDDLDDGEGVLTPLDEVATKLDLARAYMEMGDPDGARSILNEVMEEGSEGQKKEAEELISQL